MWEEHLWHWVAAEVKENEAGEASPGHQAHFTGITGSTMWPRPSPAHLLTSGQGLAFSGPCFPCDWRGQTGCPRQPRETGLCFFPAMLPAWQESSLDAHISCWSPCRARGPWGVAPSGGKGTLYGPRVGGLLFFLLLRRVPQPDQLLLSLCLGLRHRGSVTQAWPSQQALP